MKRLHAPASLRVLGLAMLAVLASGPAEATTLDPSHPVWKRPHAARWARALAERADEAALRPRVRGPHLERGISAVGRRVLVVPVLPADAGEAPVGRDELERRWFGPGENSVRGYWSVVSGGRLELEGRVLPWLRLPGTLQTDYLNVVQGNFTNDGGSRRMAADALDRVASGFGDLRFFDGDGPDGLGGSGDDDGVLDLVVIVHPFVGWEIDFEASAPSILSLQSRLRDEPGERDIGDTGLRGDAFAVVSATGPLGVWVHEFGHLLGLDDLYDHERRPVNDVGGSERIVGGLGRWSLMAGGTWGDAGRRPAGLDAWSRVRLGWDETIRVDSNFEGALGPVYDGGGSALELRPAGDWGFERFLLETRRRRQGGVVDGALPGDGVLVYRLDARRGRLRSSRAYLQLLQADGRADLANGSNDGDAGDPFDGTPGADRLDATTQPSSASSAPDPARVEPVIGIGLANADGVHPVSIDLFDGSWLQLADAGFGPVAEGRTHLSQQQSAEWSLGFVDVGSTPVGAAFLDVEVLGTGRPATVEPSTGIELRRAGALWRPAPDPVLADEGDPDAFGTIDLRITLRVDDRPARSFEIGVPVQLRPGLEKVVGMERFAPVVYAAGENGSTIFDALGIDELPRDTDAGWGLRLDGALGYGRNVDLAVESEWIGFDTRRTLEFWSRQEVDGEVAGRAWDAGVVDAFVPDRGWIPLRPRGRDVVEVLHESGATVRGRVGLGGDEWVWQPMEVDLPERRMPLRVRYRFASDEQVTARGWQVAGTGSVQSLARAELEVREAFGGRLEVLARIRGDLQGIFQIRYRYRIPGTVTWSVASGLFSLGGEGSLITPIAVPASIDVFELGLFFELAGALTPPILLGRTGFRRTEDRDEARLEVLANPARGRVDLGLDILGEPLDVRVYDLRGRAVARFSVPARTDRFTWEGRGPRGRVLASGRYVLVPDGDRGRAVSFTWLR